MVIRNSHLGFGVRSWHTFYAIDNVSFRATCLKFTLVAKPLIFFEPGIVLIRKYFEVPYEHSSQCCLQKTQSRRLMVVDHMKKSNKNN